MNNYAILKKRGLYMTNDKKKEIESGKYTKLIIESLKKYGRKHDEIFMYELANYLNSLSKIAPAFPVNIPELIRKFVLNVREIEIVDPVTHTNSFNSGKFNLQYSINDNKMRYNFFELCTEVLKSPESFKSKNNNKAEGLEKASAEYLTQIVYNVSKGTGIEHRINANANKDSVSSYSNIFSKNPLMTNILNLIAITTGLSINYVINSITSKNANIALKNEIDKVHGIGTYDAIIDVISPIIEKTNDVSFSEIDKNFSSSILNCEYNKVIDNLEENEIEQIYWIESNLINNYFNNNDEDYIFENLENLESSITCEKSKELIKSKSKTLTRPKVKVRVKDDSRNGIIVVNYILAISSAIAIVSMLSYYFVK